MSQKLVSVIIPTFNRVRLIEKAIRSVKAQTYSPVQIIVADDGSQDDTAKKVAGFENVEYYYQENKGQAAARNLGLSHAKGEYIASLDSDDVWNEDFIKVAVESLERHRADFVFLNWRETSDNKEFCDSRELTRLWQKYADNINDDWLLLNAKEVREVFVSTCPAPSSALLIRRSSLISKWNEEMRIADDWFLILEMVLTKPCRAAFTLSKYWTKHVHSTNIYHGREVLEVLRDLGLHDEPLFAERFQKQLTLAEKASLQRRLATHHFNFGRLNWKRDGFSVEALQSLANAFTLAPVGSSFYLMKLYFNHVQNRLRIARNKHKQPDEI